MKGDTTMALDESRKINLTGTSTIDGTVAERYSATIDEANPENMTLTRIIVNAQLRKDNRKACRKDQASFEDDAYSQQDALIQTDSVKGETA